MLEISAYIHMPSSNFDYNMLCAKIKLCDDLKISEALYYIGIENAPRIKASRIIDIFMQKEMWLSCRYMVKTNRYDFNIIPTTNDDIRRFYLLMSIVMNEVSVPSLSYLFLIDNKYLCSELLKLYLNKYNVNYISYQTRFYQFCPNYKSLIGTINEQIVGIKFESSIRYNWILACILIN